MISERTSLHSPTLRVRTSTCVHSIHVVAERVQTVLLSLFGACALYGNPSFFEVERQGPVRHRLGPGVSRVSDLFWPVSEW